MRLRERSFPHPVLGNADDVGDSAFQAAFQVVTNKEYFTLKVLFQCSNRTLCQFIRDGKASYVMHVECSNTFYRKRFITTDSDFTQEIPAEEINGRVEVNFFICANGSIDNYEISGAHSDYGGVQFTLSAGDVLAIADARLFDAVQDYDAVKKISSIMQIEPSPTDEFGPMQVSWDAERIRIILAQEDYRDYNHLKQYDAFRQSLTCGIVLPVLSEALKLVKQDDVEYRDLRWFRNLQERMNEPEHANESEFLVLAQRLLQMPLQRAMKSAAAHLETQD